MSKPVALIVGMGPGISGAFATSLVAAGYTVAVAARDLRRLQPLATTLDAMPFAVDAAQPASIVRLFDEVERTLGAPQVVLYNPSSRIHGDLLSLNMMAAAEAIQITALGALVTAQEAARRMLPQGSGSIFFTGATAGIKRLRQILGVRHGQVCGAWSGAKPRPRIGSRGHPCRALCDRWHGAARWRPRRLHAAGHRTFLHGRAGPAARRLELGNRVT